MKAPDKPIIKILIVIISSIPPVLMMLFSDLGANLGTSASLFLFPLLVCSFFWGVPGGIASATVSVLTMMVLIWVRAPEALTKSLVFPSIVFVILGLIIGNIFSLRKKLESEHEQLVEKETRWNILFDAIPDGIMIIEADEHRIVDLNPAAEKLMGKTRDELIGLECFSHICTTEKGNCPVTDLGQIVDSAERSIIRSGGKEIPVLKSVKKCTINDQELLIESFSDLRALKQAEQKLELSREKYEYFFEEMPIPMFSAYEDGTINSYNRSFTRILDDESSENFYIKNISDLFGNSIESEYFLTRLKSERVITNLQTALKNKDGKKITVLMNAHAIDEINGLKMIEGSFIDITAVLELEDKQRQLKSLETRSRHLDSISKLAAGMAHDINNILAGIHGHAQVIELKTDDELLQNSVKRITSGVEKADVILQGLMSSIGTYDLKIERINLVSFISSVIEEQSKDANTANRTRFVSLNDDVRVNADKNLIGEVLSELLQNSLTASENDQEILVTVGMERLSNVIYSFVESQNSEYACISVIDKGVGIAKNDIERIFEPYFTTEDFGTGAGIGLSKVYGIVQKHKGAIGVETEPGKGSSFYIYLPAAD